MSFSLPRLVWIGLEAKLDQLRRRVAQQIGQASERLTRRARTVAVALGLLCAGIMLLLCDGRRPDCALQMGRAPFRSICRGSRSMPAC